jgi:RNA polymerase sigma-70 factor (ECF subfamily)
MPVRVPGPEPRCFTCLWLAPRIPSGLAAALHGVSIGIRGRYPSWLRRRALWDEQQIDEGRALLQRAMAQRRTGPYLVQAAIADLHLQQPRDWRQIAALYKTLARQTRSPIVELNRAIAVAEIDGPDAGLAILDRLDLDHYRYFHSTRAELLHRAGRDGEAHDAYRRALDLAQTEPEQRFLQDRLAETTPSAPKGPGCANT